MSKFHIITLGCQMNKSDAERLASFLESLGYVSTDKENEAELLLINACSVRQSAIDRVYGLVRKWQKWQKNNPKIITILTGCVLLSDQEKFKTKFDLVANIGEYDKIGRFFKRKNQKSEIRNRKLPRRGPKGEIRNDDYLQVVPHYHTSYSAYVPIMTGCNNFCAYCAVPYVRGRERSRPVKAVLAEIKNLARKGYVEVTLLGQNVNSYKPADNKSFAKNNPFRHPFAALLWEVNQIKGLERIFFTASHPKDMTDEVIATLALSKMINYLHLPLQSGSNQILKKMNRHYTVTDYLKLIKKIRQARPGIAIGTDIIVGFPGETKKQFENTVKFYKKIKFDISYNAKYSPRLGTVAAKMEDGVSLAEKKRRWWVLQKLMEKIALENNQKYLGKIVSVLVDKHKNGKCEGNSSEMKRVEFVGSENLVGEVVDVKIEKVFMWILKGHVTRNM